MTRILLLRNDALSLHRLRMESRRSGVPFLYDYAATREDLTLLFGRQPSLVISTVNSAAGMQLTEIAELAGDASIPLFLVGGDTKEERNLLAQHAGRFSASCRRSRLPWLPLLLEREVRSSQDTQERHRNLITATVQLQNAAEQMRSVQRLALIGQLTGSIVHEINNPLESITNLNFLLSLDDQLPDHLRNYVALAEQELKRVAQICKQTLSFYRETEVPVRIELSALLDEVVVLYARLLREKKIEVVRRYESEEAVLIFPGEMRQVYANLLANAIEATEPGGRIVLRIHRARCTLAGTEGVRVLVADNGSGIPAEVRRSLGQPFFTTKGQSGTGLGLWVSRAIVKRYQGEIQLRSSTGPDRHGTTFSIFLPLNLGPQIVQASRMQAVSDAELHLDGIQLRAGGN